MWTQRKAEARWNEALSETKMIQHYSWWKRGKNLFIDKMLKNLNRNSSLWEEFCLHFSISKNSKFYIVPWLSILPTLRTYLLNHNFMYFNCYIKLHFNCRSWFNILGVAYIKGICGLSSMAIVKVNDVQDFTATITHEIAHL